jgi:hypothetical protein
MIDRLSELDDHQQNPISHVQNRHGEAIYLLQLGTIKSKQREGKPYGEGIIQSQERNPNLCRCVRGDGAIDPARQTPRR